MFVKEISVDFPRVSKEERINTGGKKAVQKKKGEKTRTMPVREHEGATHPEDWSTRSERGTIYMGAPPQTLSAPQDARRVQLVSRLFLAFSYASKYIVRADAI